MGNLRKYLELQAQAKTGLSSGLFVCGLVAVVFGILTAAFILLIAFIWLAERYGALLAAAMSSLSSGVNAACSVVKVDFLDRFGKAKTPQARQVRLARQVSWFVGIVAVLLILGWRPETDFARGLTQTFAWLRADRALRRSTCA